MDWAFAGAVAGEIPAVQGAVFASWLFGRAKFQVFSKPSLLDVRMRSKPLGERQEVAEPLLATA